MTQKAWPLNGIRVVTPILELRYVDDQLAAELAELAEKGIHDPDFMPFLIPSIDADATDIRLNP